VWIPLGWGILNITLTDNICQWFVAGQWFSVGTPVSHTYKTDYHNINDTRQQIIPICCLFYAGEIKIIGAQLQFLEMKICKFGWFLLCGLIRMLLICLKKKRAENLPSYRSRITQKCMVCDTWDAVSNHVCYPPSIKWNALQMTRTFINLNTDIHFIFDKCIFAGNIIYREKSWDTLQLKRLL
jgi:hypothetical protein